MTAELFDRWVGTWSKTGLDAPEDLFDNLVLRHAEPHRVYHTVRHLSESLDALAALGDASPNAEFAIWFHDAIYDVRASDSEERSADLAARSLAASGFREVDCFRVHALVLLTKHRGGDVETKDAKYVLDADLSILGAPWERFSEYGDQIRAEYAHVPNEQFRAGRTALLRHFLGRGRIFQTDLFGSELEGRARENIARAIAELETGCVAQRRV